MVSRNKHENYNYKSPNNRSISEELNNKKRTLIMPYIFKSQFNRSISEKSINKKSASKFYIPLEIRSSGLINKKMAVENINNLTCKTTYNNESLIYDLLQKNYLSYKNVRNERNSKLEQKCVEKSYDFIVDDSVKAREILNQVFDNLDKEIYSNYREGNFFQNLQLKRIAYEVFDNIKDDIESLNLETLHEVSTNTTFTILQ